LGDTANDTAAYTLAVEQQAPPFELSSLPRLSADQGNPITAPQFRALMWQDVSIARGGAGLNAAEVRLQSWASRRGTRPTRPGVELANMVLVGWLMVRAALAREESRGAHYRSDFVEARPEWRRRLAWHFTSPRPLELR
jgi:L-aspartate oxidase